MTIKSSRAAGCATGAAIVLALLFMPAATDRGAGRQGSLDTPPAGQHWAPYDPASMVLPGLSPDAYGRDCVALVDGRTVLMIACPDGQVAWFN